MKKKENPTDGYLVEQYKSGNVSALPILVKRWHRVFCEKAYWVTKDKASAKDIAQDSWITIINKIHTLEKSDSFKSWAFRIIYTKAIDHVRKISRINKNKESIKNTGTDVEVLEETRENITKSLFEAIKELPKEKQDVIRLFYKEEYSIKEISKFLKISQGTVKSRLFNTREKLKSILKSNNYEK